MNRRFLLAHLSCAALLFAPLGAVRAQIVFDGTMGPNLAGTPAPFNAGTQTFTIDASNGTPEGPNVFHSFSDFQIGTGQTAEFTSSTARVFNNVISRVTGANPTNIDGTLRSTIPGANFYFINPNGIVFGSNSSVNVPAGFHISTAHELHFADGMVFSATNPNASSFTEAAPQAFGFLNSSIGSLTVRDSTVTVAPGASISLVGGDILIEETGGTNTFINAPAGSINLTAAAGPGLVPINLLQAPSVTAFANITLRGTLGSTRIAAGTVNSPIVSNLVLRGNNVTVQGALVDMSPTGATNGGQFSVSATGTLSVTDQGFLTTNNSGSGTGANLLVNAGTIVLGQPGVDVRSGIASHVLAGGTGPGGDIHLTANSLEIQGGSFVEATTAGPGSGGNIFIDVVGTLKADATGTSAHLNGVTTQTNAANSGDAGDITVHAGAVQLINGGALTTVSSGAGAAGSILAQAADVSLNGGKISSTISGTGTPGAPTSITVQASNSLGLTNSASISASTAGAEHAANIDLQAKTITAAGLSLLQSQTSGAGNASDINIAADDLSLNTASISSNSTGQGRAGAISLHGLTGTALNHVTLANNSHISTSAGATTLVSTPGDAISIQANLIELHGSGLASSTSGGATGGPIHLAGGTLTLDASTISSSASGSGSAGDVLIVMGSVNALTGSSISAVTQAAAAAGSIFIDATDIGLDNATISNAITGTGIAGASSSISLVAGNSISVSNGSSINAQTSGAQDAANIDLTAPTVSISSSQVLGSTTGAGKASSIHIKADTLSANAGTVLSDSQGSGMPGTITLEGTHSPMAHLTLANGTLISTNVGVPTLTSLSGTDSIFIFADTVELLGNSSVVTSTSGQPSGGILHLTGHTLTLDGAASGLDTNTIAAGDGGDMLIEMDTINVLNGAFIKASTSASGHAGVVTLVGQTLTVSGAGSVLDVSGSTPVNPAIPSADGGTILIQMKDVRVLNGAQLRASTASSGNAGTIAVCCADSVLFSGAGSGAFANSSVTATGNAGKVIIKALKVDLADGARLTVRSEGTGRGGTIVVKAQQMSINDPALGGGPLTVANATGITTFISGTPGQTTASAGDVLMLVGHLNMYDGTLISTDSFGINPAGDIEIRAGTVHAEGSHTLITSTANASPNQGDAGVIAIGANDITFKDITVQTRSDTGAGGNLQLDWNGTLTSTNTTFRTDVAGATTTGTAGSIYFGGTKLAPLTPQTNVCGGLCENFDPFVGATAYSNAQATGFWVSSGDTIDASGGRGLVVINVAGAAVPPPPPPPGPDVSALNELEGKVTAAPSFQMPKFVVVPDDDFQSPCAARALGRSSSFTEGPARTRNQDPTLIGPAYYTAGTALRGTNGQASLRGNKATNAYASDVFGNCKLRRVG